MYAQLWILFKNQYKFAMGGISKDFEVFCNPNERMSSFIWVQYVHCVLFFLIKPLPMLITSICSHPVLHLPYSHQ